MYKYIRALWKNPRKTMRQRYRELLVQFRREPATLRIERPTRLDRARSLGWKPKQGVIIVRQRVKRGGKRKPFPAGGRRPKRMTNKLTLKKNYQVIAEERVARKYPNMEVVNSYLVAKDGTYAWYEVILVDREHPAVKADPQLAGIAKQRGRAFRGLTSAGRKMRGLRNKGKGAEKVRPSANANKHHGK